MRALDQGAHFTPNDCRLGLTSLEWRGEPSQGYPLGISWGPGHVGEERKEDTGGSGEVRGKRAMNERSP